MAESYADALFQEKDENDPFIPWLRGILRNGTPAGFIMCADPINTNSTPFLWRLLVDKAHQGYGVGRFAVNLTDISKTYYSRMVIYIFVVVTGVYNIRLGICEINIIIHNL